MEGVGGQQNPSVLHSSAGGVVRVERWWWCQTEGQKKPLRLAFERGRGGGQKIPSILRSSHDFPPSPSHWFGCAGHVGSGGGVGGKGLTLSQRKRSSPSRWWLVARQVVSRILSFEIKKTYFPIAVVLAVLLTRWVALRGGGSTSLHCGVVLVVQWHCDVVARDEEGTCGSSN